MIVLIDSVRYQLVTPESEAWLEKAVQSSCEHIFGLDSFYFDTKTLIRSKGGVASIPDGYVIFFTPKARWAIVEVELASHLVYDHVVTQLTKFNGGIKNISTRDKLKQVLYEVFNDDEVLKARLKRKAATTEIHKFISDLVSKEPLIVVVIDEKTEELEDALSEIKGEVKIVEFRTFRREGVSDNVNAYLFEPLGSPPDKQRALCVYSEFWAPMREEGLFKGKPVPIRDEGWISKGIRGINIILSLRNHKCSILVSLKGPDRAERGDKVAKLFAKTKYRYEVGESAKFVTIEFPVLDKGKKDREDWPEVREKLNRFGTDIYNRIKESGI
jgi:hypothetical protein